MSKNKNQKNKAARHKGVPETPCYNIHVRDLLSKEEFRDRLGLPSTRMVDELIRKRKIPVIRLGHRTARIPYQRAMEALARLEVKPVGQ